MKWFAEEKKERKEKLEKTEKEKAERKNAEGEKAEKGEKGVLDYMIELKNYSELMVDLAYAALLLDDKEIAGDVIELGKKMNRLKYELDYKVVLSRPPPDQAEGMVAVLHVSRAAEQIANNACAIAEIVLKEAKRHPLLKEALALAETGVCKEEVPAKSGIIGKTLKELHIDEFAGLHIIALKKRGKWNYLPEPKQRIEANDVLLLSGTTRNKKLLEKILR